MCVPVTGGGGFIGVWIVSQPYADGHQVRPLGNSDDRSVAAGILGATVDRSNRLLGLLSLEF